MYARLAKESRAFEVMLLIVILGMTALFMKMGSHKAVVLDLFFVPVILSAFFLGRVSAGVLALLCALCVTIATTLAPVGLASYDTPVMMGLVLTVWAAVLGMAALLTGTLCDERVAAMNELHKAYVGVIEVLSKYLQGANPQAKARSVRIAELSQAVAQELRLGAKQVDDIRVAALLHDLGHVEVTTNVISKAVNALGSGQAKHTFHGAELAHSLGIVLEGALPLLASQDDAVHDYLASQSGDESREAPLGARLIRAVRAYDDLTTASTSGDSREALAKLRNNRVDGTDDHIIDAIERVARRSSRAAALEPAFH